MGRRCCHLGKLQALWALVSVLLLIFCELAEVWVAEGYTDENDVNALGALQQEWQSPAMTSLRWTGSDPCNSKWVGITCKSSRVTSIIITGLGLPGVIPPDVGLLTALQILDLSYNNLTGELPSQLGSLTNLSMLALQSNFFGGRIPTELGQVRNLRYLRLNNNNFRGPIPHELGFLSNLYWLDLAFNNLGGPLPYSADGLNQVNAGLDRLTNAKHFHLNNNTFSGSIPGAIFHSSMTLIHLLLDSNQLKGPIPAEIGLCSELVIVKLNNNNLEGTVPSELGQLAQLTDLQLSENQLNGDLPDLSTLSNLQVLELANNSFNTDIPSWLTSLQSLTDLGMQNMIVKGAIPAGLFQLPYLTAVRLADNAINGTLNLSTASAQLSFVSLENNKITSIIQGQNTLDLRLQGNPICERSLTLSSTVCSEMSSTPTDYESSSCTTTGCPSGYMANPDLDCSCAIPYSGHLTYRAPQFTTLNNSSRIPSLISFIAHNLSISSKQILIPSAQFNRQNYLVVRILIFPNSTARWTRDDIIRMSTNLGQPDLSPDGFGPPLFQQDPYPYDVNASTTESGGLSTSIKIGVIVGGLVLGLVLIAAFIFAFWQKRRADRVKEISTSFAWSTSRPDSGAAPVMKGARRFMYDELRNATKNFSESNNIGSGGYGKVYKGILPSGQQVAIKRAEQSSRQGATEFKNEIELLSAVHHKNVVDLVGFCFDKKEQMLVYEYIANGTLRDGISGHTGVKLDWQQRLKIALGAARGIMYLHELVSPPIIHRDIKSSNILLDERRHAKVADFGLSKLGPREGSGKAHVSTQVKGTVGYLDPEYYLSEQLTEKSDVYSFGVVLLEMLTARPPIEHGKYVVKEIKTVIDSGGLAALRPMLDPHIRHETLSELNDYVSIALSCVQEAGLDRPSMSQVVKRLEWLVGDDYSGSSNVEGRGCSPQHPYVSDSEFLHTSKDTSDSSFPVATSTTRSR